MAYLARTATPLHNAPINHDTRADARPYGNEHRALRTFSGSVPHLAESGGVRVVDAFDMLAAEFLAHEIHEDLPFRLHVRSELRHAVHDDPRKSQADPSKLRCVNTQFMSKLRHSRDMSAALRRIAQLRRGDNGIAHQIAQAVDDAHLRGRPAKIDSQIHRVRVHKTPFGQAVFGKIATYEESMHEAFHSV